MKKAEGGTFIITLVTLFIVATVPCSSQPSHEAELRHLENIETEAVLKGDTLTLRRLMSHDIVVHNPENKIVTLDQIIERIKAGKINYASFERSIEKISFASDIAIVMGRRSSDQREKKAIRRVCLQDDSQISGRRTKARGN